MARFHSVNAVGFGDGNSGRFDFQRLQQFFERVDVTGALNESKHKTVDHANS